MAKTLIVDDERLMRERLRSLLTQCWPELIICGEAENGEKALALFSEFQPELVFLDIRMPGISGIEVARELSGRCHIVFASAYDQYAIEAFHQGAVDYLLKPVEEERLAVTVARLKDRIDTPPNAVDELLTKLSERFAPGSAKQNMRWIKATVGAHLRMISVDEVVYFQAEDKYTRVFTNNAEALIKKPIKELAAELDSERFWQVHRATIVRADEINHISRDLRGRMLINLKSRPEKLEVSRSYTNLFKQM